MESAWPLWALPFWTMGIPLIWAAVEVWRTPKGDSTPTHFGVRTNSAGPVPVPLFE